MKKAVLTGPYTIDLQECERPRAMEGQVLLRVVAIGVCGSDVQMFHGLHKYMTYPVVPGHEVAAVVEAVGQGVTGFKAGDKVTVQPQLFCGECYPCQSGRPNVCENLAVMGVHADGFAAEYVAVDASMVLHCPQDMAFDDIALVEPAAVGLSSVRRARYKDATIAVIGAGTIGNLVAQAAVALGAADVLVTDIMEEKLALAKKCGIPHCVNAAGTGLTEAVAAAFGSRGADVIIDAAATTRTFAQALDASRPGSEIVITGNYKEPVSLEMPRIQRREVNLIGHMMYRREDYAETVRLLAAGKIKTEGFVTTRFPLERSPEAFTYIDGHTATMKVLIDVGE